MYLTIQVRDNHGLIKNSPIWISLKSYRESEDAKSINRIIKGHKLYRIAMEQIENRGVLFPSRIPSELKLKELKVEDGLEIQVLCEIIAASDFDILWRIMYRYCPKCGRLTKHTKGTSGSEIKHIEIISTEKLSHTIVCTECGYSRNIFE